MHFPPLRPESRGMPPSLPTAYNTWRFLWAESADKGAALSRLPRPCPTSDTLTPPPAVPRRETPAITNCCNMSVLVTLRKYHKIVIGHCASFSSITFTISLNYFLLHHMTLQEDGFRIPKYFHTQAGNVG